MSDEKCSVKGCNQPAEYEVIFYDVYLHPTNPVTVFYERHESCPFVCQEHLSQNERNAKTQLDKPELRAYRNHVDYPHTKSEGQGFVIYRPL